MREEQRVGTDWKTRGIALVSMVLAVTLAGYGFSRHSRPPQTTAGFSVSGDIPAVVHLQAEDLDKLPQEAATVQEEDGSSSKYTGVLLRSVLQRAGAPIGKSLRGKSLASYVLAKARDGYQVVFSLAELDAAFGNERVLVAYKIDGKPLFDFQGPFRILCPNDKAGARSLRMLDSLEVVRLRK